MDIWKIKWMNEWMNIVTWVWSQRSTAPEGRAVTKRRNKYDVPQFQAASTIVQIIVPRHLRPHWQVKAAYYRRKTNHSGRAAGGEVQTLQRSSYYVANGYFYCLTFVIFAMWHHLLFTFSFCYVCHVSFNLSTDWLLIVTIISVYSAR
jgi:hypothetical protein